MTTRAIVTSQPDVTCDVCERRLLRGEQPDVFLADGQPRMVCELCAPRAAHQGWKRGSQESELVSAPPPARRGRRLFERLRQSRTSSPYGAHADAPAHPAQPDELLADGPFDEPSSERGDERRASPARAGAASNTPDERPAPSVSDGPLQQALDVFNAGPYTRRVASLTRSLGTPEVTVRAGEAVASCVVIVLAWELCWYTYEVDLDDLSGVQARALAQGTELSQLGPDDRLANALADERGALALA
ncbi:MAG TPA: hypothetical protein VGH09_02985 [Solirubrobacteraceae bacterium]|jgi:hypothetical protein